MDIVKSVKNIGSEIEKGASTVVEKLEETLENVASHLPLSNLAKKDDSSFHVEVDLPGVKKEDIDIRVEDGVLVVSAVRHYKNELSRDDYYVCESSFGKFERRFILPDTVDSDKISAKFEDGRLNIELEKTKSAKPKTISIK
ncbi:Hsp20/alpha crystallin family protein [Sulfurimonas sp.]|uniref:Hsp20/alpha crystallin family protein n=1 Tax=Sulfurimonas sp. TaxID=2022749 RepID=UPI00260A3B0C|nr:Hsp20/alpha crystallin family protein [Sulfurimonas sp.]